MTTKVMVVDEWRPLWNWFGWSFLIAAGSELQCTAMNA